MKRFVRKGQEEEKQERGISMQALLSPLTELADYQEIVKNRGKEEGFIQIAGCVNSQKTHLMYAL